MTTPTLRRMQNLLGQLDCERPQYRPRLTEMPALDRTVVARHNLLHATLETLNAIPVVSTFSGALSVFAGVVELIAGLGSWGSSGDPDAPAAMRSGAKIAILGAMAAVLPGVGNATNAVFAAGDIVDTLNTGSTGIAATCAQLKE